MKIMGNSQYFVEELGSCMWGVADALYFGVC